MYVLAGGQNEMQARTDVLSCKERFKHVHTGTAHILGKIRCTARRFAGGEAQLEGSERWNGAFGMRG